MKLKIFSKIDISCILPTIFNTFGLFFKKALPYLFIFLLPALVTAASSQRNFLNINFDSIESKNSDLTLKRDFFVLNNVLLKYIDANPRKTVDLTIKNSELNTVIYLENSDNLLLMLDNKSQSFMSRDLCVNLISFLILKNYSIKPNSELLKQINWISFGIYRIYIRMLAYNNISDSEFPITNYFINSDGKFSIHDILDVEPQEKWLPLEFYMEASELMVIFIKSFDEHNAIYRDYFYALADNSEEKLNSEILENSILKNNKGLTVENLNDNLNHFAETLAVNASLTLSSENTKKQLNSILKVNCIVNGKEIIIPLQYLGEYYDEIKDVEQIIKKKSNELKKLANCSPIIISKPIFALSELILTLKTVKKRSRFLFSSEIIIKDINFQINRNIAIDKELDNLESEEESINKNYMYIFDSVDVEGAYLEYIWPELYDYLDSYDKKFR